MRYNVLKKHSTKYERKVYEILKELHISFKHRWLIEGREIDFFILGKYCLEINGHDQDTNKNEMLANLGYVPLHLHNNEIDREVITNLINKIKKI